MRVCNGFVSRREGDLYGAKATLNVWKPNVTSANEFSLSQIWVIHHAPGPLFNTIEAGWQVYPKMYKHSHLPKFFIYWTPDGYETGCLNLLCPGFVQTNNRNALGASVVPTSIYNGKQYDIAILIWKDPSSGNWWLIFGKELVEKNVIGYWPASNKIWRRSV